MRILRRLSTLLVAGLVAGAIACDEPTLREYEPQNGLIRGTVFYQRGTERGNVIVLLFRATELPPPTGSGRPVNFVVVPQRDLFGDSAAGVVGDFTAPFTIPAVPAGRYQIRAFLDADGDFNPLYDLTGQASAGDVGGGYVDTATRRFIEFEVKTNQVVESGVLVVLAQPFPLERPAFAVTSSTGVVQLEPAYDVPLRAPASLTLVSHPINRTEIRMAPERSGFLVGYADDDGNGVPDDVNADGLADLYPRVLLRRIKDADDQRTLIVPLIINPLPFQDALAVAGAPKVGTASVTRRLDLIVPPAAVEVTAAGRVVLPAAPPGRYEVVVISSTGQTWQIPNNLDVVQPSATDPTQQVSVELRAGPPLPEGEIRGRLEVDTTSVAPGYVIAFRAADPPPPAGTGRPVALASVITSTRTATGLSGEFVLRGLPPDLYILSALYDLDRDFSPLVSIVAQPSAGDLLGAHPSAVQVGLGPATEQPVIRATRVVPVERPAFAITGGTVRLTRRPTPQAFEVERHPIEALKQDQARTRFLVSLAGTPPPDVDGDHFPDLYPRVLLTRMVDGPAPERAIDDPERIIIPGIVEPLPFLTALGAGAPLVPADKLRVIVPPIAFRVSSTGARTPISPIPAGRYRVNVLSPTGQTWSVPSDANTAFARLGKPTADATQGQYVEVMNDAVPGGVITGEVETSGLPLVGDFRVVVFAFSTSALPPPAGTGRPFAVAVLSPDAFSGTRAAYRLAGLPTGRYQVRAFFDRNGNFTPWFDTLSQPDTGDVPGVYLDGAAPGEVVVDALGAPVEGRLVTLIPPQAFTHDRPVSTLPAGTSISRQTGGLVRLEALSSTTDVLQATGRFVVVPRDPAQGTVYPQIIAELLDPMDPTHLRTAATRVIIPGLVDPAQVGIDPMDPQALAVVSVLDVTFPPVGIDPTTGMSVGRPPAGLYRINVIHRSGQTWSFPNELSRATGDVLAGTQGRFLTVME